MPMYDNWPQNAYGRQPYNNGYNQMQPVSQSPFLMVPTIADVDKVVLQSGETRWIMVQNDAILAVKTANAMGYATAEYYRLTKIDPATMRASLSGPEYVTADQVDEKIQAAIAQAMSQIQTAPAAKTTRAKEA